MATGAHRRPGRALRHLLRAGRDLVADLDDLPASGEVWTDQLRVRDAREDPEQRDPPAVRPPAQAPDADPPARELDWWADPSTTETARRVPRARGRVVGRAQAYLGWRRTLR